MGDGTDTASKLLDPYPLTPAERGALVQLHDRSVQCRQIMMSYAARNAPQEAALFQDYIYRSDAIFGKLTSGELPVGMANKLSIENDRELQTDLAGASVGGTRREEVARERATDAMLQESEQIAASLPQPTTATPNCTWLGNILNCASVR
jgi:hypothetical protein